MAATAPSSTVSTPSSSPTPSPPPSPNSGLTIAFKYDTSKSFGENLYEFYKELLTEDNGEKQKKIIRNLKAGAEYEAQNNPGFNKLFLKIDTNLSDKKQKIDGLNQIIEILVENKYPKDEIITLKQFANSLKPKSLRTITYPSIFRNISEDTKNKLLKGNLHIFTDYKSYEAANYDVDKLVMNKSNIYYSYYIDSIKNEGRRFLTNLQFNFEREVERKKDLVFSEYSKMMQTGVSGIYVNFYNANQLGTNITKYLDQRNWTDANYNTFFTAVDNKGYKEWKIWALDKKNAYKYVLPQRPSWGKSILPNADVGLLVNDLSLKRNESDIDQIMYTAKITYAKLDDTNKEWFSQLEAAKLIRLNYLRDISRTLTKIEGATNVSSLDTEKTNLLRTWKKLDNEDETLIDDQIKERKVKIYERLIINAADLNALDTLWNQIGTDILQTELQNEYNNKKTQLTVAQANNNASTTTTANLLPQSSSNGAISEEEEEQESDGMSQLDNILATLTGSSNIKSVAQKIQRNDEISDDDIRKKINNFIKSGRVDLNKSLDNTFNKLNLANVLVSYIVLSRLEDIDGLSETNKNGITLKTIKFLLHLRPKVDLLGEDIVVEENNKTELLNKLIKFIKEKMDDKQKIFDLTQQPQYTNEKPRIPVYSDYEEFSDIDYEDYTDEEYGEFVDKLDQEVTKIIEQGNVTLNESDSYDLSGSESGSYELSGSESGSY